MAIKNKIKVISLDNKPIEDIELSEKIFFAKEFGSSFILAYENL